MPNKNDKKRKAPISYRPPKELREEFDARVQNSGLSTNAFRTEAVFGKGRHRPVELEKLAVILAKAAQISDQLPEISLAGSDDSALAIESAFIHFRSVMRTGRVRVSYGIDSRGFVH